MERCNRVDGVGRRRKIVAAGAAALAATAALASGCTKNHAASNPVAEKPYTLDCTATETQMSDGSSKLELGYPRKLILLDPEVANGQNPPTYWGAQVVVKLGSIVKGKSGKVLKKTETENIHTWVSVINAGGPARLEYGADKGEFPINDWMRETNHAYIPYEGGYAFYSVSAFFSYGRASAVWSMTPGEIKPKETDFNKISQAFIQCDDSYGEPGAGQTRTTVGVSILVPPKGPNGKDLPIPGE